MNEVAARDFAETLAGAFRDLLQPRWKGRLGIEGIKGVQPNDVIEAFSTEEVARTL